MRQQELVLSILLLWAASSTQTGAQTVFGRISGTVTDESDASIPGAKVTIVNESTRATRMVSADDRGYYVVTNLPVGTYSITAEAQGFQSQRRTGYHLVADGRISVDFKLRVGSLAETVSVTAPAGETVNPVSGEIGRVVDRQQVEDLALNARNYMQLVSLVPGAVLLDEDQVALTTDLYVGHQSVNGNRGNTNLLTVDGGFNLDSGSNNSQINNVGIDFIEEIKIQTSNFSAEYGRKSGASINVVTRSGDNSFHGGLFEYLRNDRLDARSFFAPRAEKLRFNDFGWSLGGPIRKDRLFFFAGQEWKYLRRETAAQRSTLPTRAERRGDFSERAGSLFYPGTQTAVPNQNISALLTPDGRAIAAVYGAMEKQASWYDDRPLGNNAIFQLANPLDYRQDLLRLDYRWNDQHSTFGRMIRDHNDLLDPLRSGLPTTPLRRVRPGSGYQVSHTWLISPALINEAKVNAAWHSQRRNPVGELWRRETYGFRFPELFSGGRFLGGIPNVSVTGFSSFSGPSFLIISPTTDLSFSDNMTWIRGGHSVKAGIVVIRNRKDQNGTPPYNGSVSFTPSGNPNTTGNAFADALLGNFRTYTEAEFDPVGFFRFNQLEAFISDNWKVSRKFSVEIGARYHYMPGIYTQANNMTNFDPRYYDPARAVTVTRAGLIVPGSGNRYNGLVRAGQGVPESELGRVPNARRPEVLAVPAGAPRGFYETPQRLAPRFSFGWSPFTDGKTAVRGGFGMFYDRPEGNVIFGLINTPPFSETVSLENGNLANPSGGTPSALTPFGSLNAIDTSFKPTYTMNYSLSVQREFLYGLFAEAAYVGNLGRNLTRRPDSNQPSFETLAANAALPASQRASVNALRPYAGFSQIMMQSSDSNSNYHALQLYVARRRGVLTFTSGYTWSKVLTDASSSSANPEEPFNRRFNYGPADFDRTHVFFATYSWLAPAGRGLRAPARAVLADWEVSGITRLQSGAPFTLVGNTAIGVRRADYIGGAVSLPADQRTVDRFFNAAAFRPAPDQRRGNSGVGILRGPGLALCDLSFRKSFPLREKMTLRFQADLFNIFNRVNFRALGVNVSNRDFGSITSSGPGRNVQFGLRFAF